MAATTPSGYQAMAVDVSNPVLTSKDNWIVQGGVLTAITPTAAQLLATAQATQKAVIADAFKNATYNVPISYMGTTFFTDQNSQTMLSGALTVLNPIGSTPAGFSWWDATDTAVPMTLAQL